MVWQVFRHEACEEKEAVLGSQLAALCSRVDGNEAAITALEGQLGQQNTYLEEQCQLIRDELRHSVAAEAREMTQKINVDLRTELYAAIDAKFKMAADAQAKDRAGSSNLFTLGRRGGHFLHRP